MYLADNPANYYGTIECAAVRDIVSIDGLSDITFEDLALCYGGAHGIAGGNTHHITIRNCDISDIGGGIWQDSTRFGNGIQFWGDCHDNVVEACALF